jgi:hypothetical protein
MKFKYVIYTILILIAAGVGIGLKMYFKPHADVSKLAPAYSVKASELMAEFTKDEKAATVKYVQKPIEIEGKLAAKSKLPNGNDLLVLEDEMQGVSCELDSVWSAANQPVVNSLTTGSPVTVKGICKGYLMEVKVSPAVVVNQ